MSAVSDFRELVADFTEELRSFLAVIVIEVFAWSIAVRTTGGIRDDARGIASANGLEFFAGIEAVKFKESLPIGCWLASFGRRAFS